MEIKSREMLPREEVELEEDLNSYNLPRGVQGKVAIYSDSFTHVSIIRRVLLRMLGWINYVFPMK